MIATTTMACKDDDPVVPPSPDASPGDPDAAAGEPDGGGGGAADASPGAPDASPATPDAAPPGDPDAGPPDTTACDDTHAGAMFCADFEGPTIGDDGLGVYDNYGTSSLTTTGAHRGASSLRAEVDLPDGQPQAAAVSIWDPPADLATTGDLYLRSYVKFDPVVPGSTGRHVVQQFQRNSGNYASITVYYEADQRLTARIGAPVEVYLDPTGAPPTVAPDEWVCVELHVVMASDNTGSAQVFLNGALVLESTGQITVSPEGPYTQAQIGIGYAAASRAEAVMYADEFVVDDEPIGCD